jgi:hypothetical protein
VLDAARAYLRGEEPVDPRGAVRSALRILGRVAPGRSVEIRIPPYAAAQAIAGTTHRRGTPAAVVETDARTWVLLASGDLGWTQAVASGRVRASGERSDLRPWLPLVVSEGEQESIR